MTRRTRCATRFRFGLHSLILTLGLAAFAQSAIAIGSGVFQLHPLTSGFGGAGEMVKLGDLNQDGRPDAVVAGALSTTIWLNDGSGNFSPHPGTPTLGAGGTVALGDVNGDGRIDIVVSGSVFLGTLTGWIPHPTTPTFGTGGYVALGNLDGDNDLDAVLNGTVWLNDGSGSFTAHPTTPSFSAVAFTSVTLGNLDGDGDLDVVATGNQLVYVFRNDGAGNFTPHPTTPTFGTPAANKLMQQAVLGDVDGDGLPDVLAILTDTGGGASTNLVLRNGGTGNLTLGTSFPGNTRVALGSVDLSSGPDALTDTAQGVFKNTGDGGFTPHATPTNFGASVTFIELGDIDGDGDLDALVSHDTGATSVWVNIDLVSYNITATANPPAGGSASCAPNPVFSGFDSTCNATANAGYTFTSWSGDCSGATCTLANVNSHKSVTANFTLNTYPITTAASPTAGGTVQCTNNPVSHGGGSTCTATPNPGFTFANWSGDCSGSTCTLTGVTSAKTVTAIFTSNTHAVMTAANPTNGGTVSCSPNPVPNGGSTTCTATANAGFQFAGWSGDCTGATCTISNITSAKSVTAAFVPVDPSGPPRLGNISTRAQVLTGQDVLIGGFVVGGSANKTVAVVATGPSLSSFGIANPLANPTLRLVRSSDQALMATNDDWQTAANSAQLAAAGLAPSNSLEAAILIDLPPGAYTAIVEGVGGGTGVSVVGVYEVDGPTTPLINISTRGRVGTGDDVMIGGFVVQGSGPQTVGIVATGPSLAAFGITSPLANPTLTLVRSSDQVVVATNDDWQTDANASQLQAAGLAPVNPLESGLYVTLPPGAYTAVVSGVGGGTGIAVIGVYKAN